MGLCVVFFFYRNFNSKHRWYSSETQAPAFIFSGSISLAISSFLISAIVLGPFFSLVPAKPWPDSRSSKLASETLGLVPDSEEYKQKHRKHLFKLIKFSPRNIRWKTLWTTDKTTELKSNLLLTHASLCFDSCAGRATSHCGEADVVVGSVPGRCVRHGGVAGAGLWLRGGSLSLGLPSSTASSTCLPRREAVLRRWRRSWWGAHGRDERCRSSGSGGFAGEARTWRRKGDYDIQHIMEIIKTEFMF